MKDDDKMAFAKHLALSRYLLSFYPTRPRRGGGISTEVARAPCPAAVYIGERFSRRGATSRRNMSSGRCPASTSSRR